MVSLAPALETALVASVADPKMFRSGRDFSAWIGLVPKQNSSGGKDRLGNIKQTRRSLSAQLVHYWRTRRGPLCQDPWHQASALAHRVADAATHEGRSYRARQQDRQDGVGDDGQGRTLQRTGRSRGVNEIAPGIRRDVKVGRANST